MRVTLRRPRAARVAAAAAIAATLAAAAVPAAAAEHPRAALFARPSSIAAIGPWVVVANRASSTLTVLSDRGALVRRVEPKLLGVVAPTSAVAEVLGSTRVVLVAGVGGPVAELAFSRKGAALAVQRLRVVHPSGCGAKAASYLAVAGGLVVEACANGAVAAWHPGTGVLAWSDAASVTGLTDATGLAIVDSTVAVTNAKTLAGSAPDGVTQLSASTGAKLRTVTNAQDASYAFGSPSGIASDGTHLWEINATSNSVDELAGSTLHFLGSSTTNLSDPGAVVATPSFTWVSSSSWPGQSSMVTQFQVQNQSLQSPWMMCNSNGPYRFSNPSGFALHSGVLWVANEANSRVDKMNATSGALLGSYT